MNRGEEEKVGKKEDRKTYYQPTIGDRITEVQKLFHKKTSLWSSYPALKSGVTISLFSFRCLSEQGSREREKCTHHPSPILVYQGHTHTESFHLSLKFLFY